MKGRTSKRILSALLSLVMLLSLLPVSVFAAETETTATWTKVALSDITATDTVAITMTKDNTTWVLPNDGDAKDAAEAITGTVSGNTLTTSEAAKFGWKIVQNEETFQIVSASDSGKYLYSTSSNNGIRQGTGDSRDWKVDADSGYLYNVGQTRYVGVYNSQDWRSYTTVHANIAGQTLAFYKLDAAGGDAETIAAPTANYPDGSELEVGTKVTFTAADGTTIKYKTGNGDWHIYSEPIPVNSYTAFTVKAVRGTAESEEVTFTYKAYNVVTQYIRTMAADLEGGDQVLIYNPSNGKIMTTEGYTYTNKNTGKSKDELVAADATVTGSELTTTAIKAAVLTVTKDANDKYTFTTADGKYLYMDGTNVRLVDTADEYTLFQLETTEGGYFVKADTANYNGNAQYLEYYGGYFTVFGMGSNTAIYTFQFFKATLVRDYVDAVTPTEKVATPTASPAAGEIAKGTEVTFVCPTEGAKILYKTTGDYEEYTGPIAVNEDTTFIVKATKEGMYDSDEITFAYTVKAETGDKYVLADTINTGDEIVIYYPTAKKIMTTESYTYTNKNTSKSKDELKAADATVTGSELTTAATNAAVLTVTKDANGKYAFTTADGKYLYMDGTHVRLVDTADEYTLFQLESTEGGWFIKADTANYNGNAQYLEYFGGYFTVYGMDSTKVNIYTFQFYKLVRATDPVSGLQDGDQVAIYNDDSGNAISTTASGSRLAGVATTLDGEMVKSVAGLAEFTVHVNEQNQLTFVCNGKYLTSNATGGQLTLADAESAYSLWEAEQSGSSFYLKNANAKYTSASSVKPQYLEFYNSNFTTFGLGNGGSAFAMTFRKVAADTPDADALPKAGDKVVIYSAAAQAALAAENDSQSIEKSSTTVIENGKLTMGNGAAIFTVEENGEYLRFHNETYGYLCANGTGNNAFYSKDFSEAGVTTNDADWLVRECSGGVGGFEMESRVAKYSGHSQWLEYYSDSFKTYSMYSKTGDLDYTIYSFSFYPVADGVHVDGGIVNVPSVWFDNALDAYLGQDYTLPFGVDAPFGVKTISAKLGENDALTVTEGEDGSYTVTVPKDKVVGSELTITVSGTDEKGVSFEGRVEIPVVDEPSIVDVFPAANAQTLNDKRPAIGATLVNVRENPTITMMVQGVEVTPTYDAATGKVTYTPAEDMEDGGKVVVSLTVKRNDNKEVTKTWSFTVGKAQFTAYFGQLHGHTQYSDGSGTLESALDYIANLHESANVQFVAFTDHSNYFDTTDAANPEGALYNMSLASEYSQNIWNTYKATIDKFNAAHSNIIAIGGFEMTWSGGPGHINTFNTPGIVSRNNKTLNNKTSDSGMKAYYALLSQSEGTDSISQFNHPGTTFGNFSDFSYWDPVIDSRMYMVEVGNGEGQIGAGGYYPSYEQYIMALDKGWHVAPTNNQDNHKGKWGNANDARDVILTDNFTKEGIYQAIRDMNMYATEDKNLLVNYSVNGQIMGSSITDIPESLDISVSVNDPDPTDSIAKVEVVVNSGKVAYTWDDAAELAAGELSVTLDPDYSYYFIRVTEADGDLAVTAPVWVGETLKLGISNLTCGTSTPVTNEELTLTTTLFNSEASDATVKSLTYTVNGSQVIGTDATGYTVAASSTQDVTFKWTPDKARSVTIKVTAVVEQNDKEYTFTKDITLDVLNADDLVYIGIDASHYNEYVAGNYKDSMGNFGELAAGHDVRTVQLNTSEELIAACSNPKFKALILTAPSRRLAAAQSDPKTYSAEELAAIAAFNDNGGTVILAGWSDNYENYDVIQSNPAIKHMAATQNEVLAALGSSLRISDDATYDDVRSAADGVDKWRLYFSDYNMDNPLNNGVIYDAEHPYDKLYTERFSHYGGASIYAVDADGNTTSTLPATVSPVVYGHATSYSVDVDKDGLGGAGTPKYAYAENDNRLMVMATEQLAGKGLIVVSGAAFMSNFEVQAQVDNGAEKNYSNYRICENLLSLLNPVKISTVAAVQAEKDEGVKFTIEAIVTSNASGYDKDTAFFDCIYVQDDTAGINCFPVAGNFKIGDKVRITGTTSSYQGERQLAVTSIEKIGEAEAPAPKDVTAAQVNDGSVLGSLIRVKGVITKVEKANGLVQTILVRDADGNECRVFIDGYITTSEDVKDAEVGREIDVVGLSSYDDTFTLADGTAIAPRIRIRDRADVKCGEMVDPGTCQHPSSSWKTVKSATCTTPGKENLVCSRCGTILDTRVIAKLAHVDENHDKKCDVCGKKLSTTVPSVTPSTPVNSSKTADNSTMGLWVVLMSLSLFGSVTLLRSKKRRA